jgi:acetyl-CoA carboxylase carboxyltransferase component
MAQEVIGENVTLEEMGGARMHTSISGCADNLAMSDTDAIEQAKMYFTFMPLNWRELPPKYSAAEPLTPLSRSVLPNVETAGYDIRNFIKGLVDDESFFEVKPDWATELVTGFALLDGNVVGVVANNPMIKGGVLFVDSADKAARFVWLCDAYNIPLIFLADVPGFMIGTQVERQGIIRHGAKMITAVSEATVPKVCVVLRKAYGAGLYAMAGPAFDPVATLALPTARIAVMGPEAAVNNFCARRYSWRVGDLHRPNGLDVEVERAEDVGCFAGVEDSPAAEAASPVSGGGGGPVLGGRAHRPNIRSAKSAAACSAAASSTAAAAASSAN